MSNKLKFLPVISLSLLLLANLGLSFHNYNQAKALDEKVGAHRRSFHSENHDRKNETRNVDSRVDELQSEIYSLESQLDYLKENNNLNNRLTREQNCDLAQRAGLDFPTQVFC